MAAHQVFFVRGKHAGFSFKPFELPFIVIMGLLPARAVMLLEIFWTW